MPVVVLVVAAVTFSSCQQDPPRPATLPAETPVLTLTPEPRVAFRGRQVTLLVSRHPDEIHAYREVLALQNAHPGLKFLTTASGGAAVRAELPNNLLRAIGIVEHLRRRGVIASSDWAATDENELRKWWGERGLFDHAYSVVPPGAVSTLAHPSNLVAHIAAVASFFKLPPDVFVSGRHSGLGSEYMQWRRRPHSDDVVLLRHKDAVLTASRNSVEWQEIYRSLERAHQLYLGGARDYSRLPPEVLPPGKFDEEISPEALFFYAALLLRDFVGRSDGSSREAADLFRVRPDDPSVRQEAGARRASLYARQALTHAWNVHRQRISWEFGTLP